MAIEEKLSQLTDAQIKSLGDNVARIALIGSDRQRAEAERLGPLVAAEAQARAEVARTAKAEIAERARAGRASRKPSAAKRSANETP